MGFYASCGLDECSGIKTKMQGLSGFMGMIFLCVNNLAYDAFGVEFLDEGGNLLKDISFKAGTIGWLTRTVDLINEEYAAENLSVSCYDAYSQALLLNLTQS